MTLAAPNVAVLNGSGVPYAVEDVGSARAAQRWPTPKKFTFKRDLSTLLSSSAQVDSSPLTAYSTISDAEPQTTRSEQLPLSLQGTPSDPSSALLRQLRAQRSQEEGARPCDACRRRRVKCDRAQPHCGRCVELSLKCTHDDVLMRRGPPKREEREAFKVAGIVYQTERQRRKERKLLKQMSCHEKTATSAAASALRGGPLQEVNKGAIGKTRAKLEIESEPGAGKDTEPKNAGVDARRSFTQSPATTSSASFSSRPSSAPGSDNIALLQGFVPFENAAYSSYDTSAYQGSAISQVSESAATAAARAEPIPMQVPAPANQAAAYPATASQTQDANGIWLDIVSDGTDMTFFDHRVGRKPQHLSTFISNGHGSEQGSGIGQDQLIDAPLPPIEMMLWSLSSAAEESSELREPAPVDSTSNAAVDGGGSMPWDLQLKVVEAQYPSTLSSSVSTSTAASDALPSYAPKLGQFESNVSLAPIISVAREGTIAYPTEVTSTNTPSAGMGSPPPVMPPLTTSNLTGSMRLSNCTRDSMSSLAFNTRPRSESSLSNSGPLPTLQQNQRSDRDDERLKAPVASRQVLLDLLDACTAGFTSLKLTAGACDEAIALGRTFEGLQGIIQEGSPATLVLDENGLLQVHRVQDYFGSMLECQRRDFEMVGPGNVIVSPDWANFVNWDITDGVYYPKYVFDESDFDALRARAGRMLLHPAIPPLLAEYVEYHHQAAMVVQVGQVMEMYQDLCHIARGRPTNWSPMSIRHKQAIIFGLVMQGSWTHPGLDIVTGSALGASTRCALWELGHAAAQLAWALSMPRHIVHDDEECTPDLVSACLLWTTRGTLGQMQRVTRYAMTLTPLLRRLGAFQPVRMPPGLTQIERECLHRQAWRTLQAKVIVILWTGVKWTHPDLLQDHELKTLPWPQTMPGETFEEGGHTSSEALTFFVDMISLSFRVNEVCASSLRAVAMHAEVEVSISRKLMIEQLAARYFQELQDWAGLAACMRPQAIGPGHDAFLPEGVQFVKRFCIGLNCSYLNITLTIIRAALRAIHSTMQIRSSLTQATLAALDATAPPQQDRFSLFFDSLALQKA